MVCPELVNAYTNFSVGNLAHVHFAAQMFSLPLKTAEHPHMIYSEQEMYMVLAIISVYIFFDLDPTKSFPLRLAARAVTQQLGKLIETNVKAVNMTGWVATLVDGRRGKPKSTERLWGPHDP